MKLASDPGTNVGATFRRSRGRPKTTSDENRRAEIVSGATEAFLELGYAGTTTDIVAARCKISKQTLYRIFPSKIELFSAMVVSQRRSMLNLPRERDDKSLDQAIEAIFRMDNDIEPERGHTAFLRLALFESSQFPEIGSLVREHVINESRRLLAEWLAGQGARGSIHVDDADSAAAMLMDMIFSPVFLKPCGDEDWKGRDRRRAHFRRCIDVFLNGVRRYQPNRMIAG